MLILKNILKWVVGALLLLFVAHLMLGELSPLNLYMLLRDAKSKAVVNSADEIPLDSLGWVDIGSLNFLAPSSLELTDEGRSETIYEKVYMFYKPKYGVLGVVVDGELAARPVYGVTGLGEKVLRSRLEKGVKMANGRDLKLQVDSIKDNSNLVYFSGSYINGANLPYYSNTKVEFLSAFHFYNERFYNLVTIERLGDESENSNSNMEVIFNSIIFVDRN